ncbi:hypothetical protein NPIL_285871 [Nephila pilipes]|uniref:Uncharacterized protein n=1 Tax=Nephila pilipes TaxID=299642 RepID=A0A8X6TN48_NEPPI|nr:hypothetical protein NPIL_285871 [Nephila pilipes]
MKDIESDSGLEKDMEMKSNSFTTSPTVDEEYWRRTAKWRNFKCIPRTTIKEAVSYTTKVLNSLEPPSILCNGIRLSIKKLILIVIETTTPLESIPNPSVSTPV